MDIQEKVKHLPLSSGVYLMKSSKGKVLYVGKASSIKKRVASYFSPKVDPKTRKLIDQTADIDYIECDSPEQALILEAALIKENRPKYNIALRDSKSYPYIEITKDKFSRIFVSRPKGKRNSILFGPYPVAKNLKPALVLIRKIFPYRSCRNMPKTPCLFYHLKLCPAPCAGKVSAKEYNEIIRNISKILKGQRRQLVKKLKEKMKKLSSQKKFEEAAEVRNTILAIENLYKGKPKEHQVITLKEVLGLKKIPLVIEAIDISSLGAQDSVGSVVVFKEGTPDKSSYRRFLIKEVEGQDDYAKIAEVVRRRYRRLKKENKQLPDLIIIDGGKGHVVVAGKELKKLELPIAIIGIAKKNEEIWFPDSQKSLFISKDNPGLHLVQRARDEAHRFAHSYQLTRRKKKNNLP